MQVLVGNCYFDTEAATVVWHYEGSAHPCASHGSMDETLYLTAKGNYMLQVDGECGWRDIALVSEFFPLSPEDALEWARDRGIEPKRALKHFSGLIRKA